MGISVAARATRFRRVPFACAKRAGIVPRIGVGGRTFELRELGVMDFLIIEDDRLVAETIRKNWPVAGDSFRIVTSYSQSLQIIQTTEVDAFDGVILDIHLPDGDGITILRTIRSNTNLPVILISGSGSANTRAEAIDLGADDYVMKPFSVRELQARVSRQVNSRTSSLAAAKARSRFTIREIDCDLSRRRMRNSANEQPLTDAEARILETLYNFRNRICSKTTLYKTALFREFNPEDKTLDVYISRLRKKMNELDMDSAECLQTVRGMGYRLEL